MKGKGVLKEHYEEHEDADGNKSRQRTGKMVVVRVTTCTKVSMICFVQIPVLVMNVFLLWIGCRWLMATLGFGEVLLNAVALEFVLNLHQIFYKAVVPYTMKNSLGSILLPQGMRSEKPSWFNMLSAFGLFGVAVVWITLYIRVFQEVLPDYNWDIASACNLFMAEAQFVPNGE